MFKLCRTVFLLGLVLKMAVAADDFKDLVDPPEEFERVQSVIRERGIAESTIPIEPLTPDYVQGLVPWLAPQGFEISANGCKLYLEQTLCLGNTLKAVVNDPAFAESPSDMESILDRWKERRHGLIDLILAKKEPSRESDYELILQPILKDCNKRARLQTAVFYQLERKNSSHNARLHQPITEGNFDALVDPVEEIYLVESEVSAYDELRKGSTSFTEARVQPLTNETIQEELRQLRTNPLETENFTNRLMKYMLEGITLRHTFALDSMFSYSQEYECFCKDVTSVFDRWRLRRYNMFEFLLQQQLVYAEPLKEAPEYLNMKQFNTEVRQISEERKRVTLANFREEESKERARLRADHPEWFPTEPKTSSE